MLHARKDKTHIIPVNFYEVSSCHSEVLGPMEEACICVHSSVRKQVRGEETRGLVTYVTRYVLLNSVPTTMPGHFYDYHWLTIRATSM